MIYITQIELENFQSHKYSLLKFDRGLNVIVGNSDSGKTAILRAMKWVLYNEPSGDYFIRQGEKKVSVTVVFNTGAIVRRMRSASKNSYYLKTPKGEEFHFEGFGNAVPQEIIDCIGMYKIHLDNDSTSILNIAEQLDGPFILNEKPSLRASAIGRLVGVNYIDDALRDVVRDNKKLLHDLRYLREKQEDLTEKIKAYDYVKELEKKQEQLQNIRDEITVLMDRKNFYEDLKNQWSDCEQKLIPLKNLIHRLVNLENIQQNIYEIEGKKYPLLYLKRLSEQYHSNEKELQIVKKSLSELKNTDDITNLIAELKKLLSFQASYQKFFSVYSTMNKEEKILKKELLLTQKVVELQNLLSKLENTLVIYQKYMEYFEKLKGINQSLALGCNYMSNFIHLQFLQKAKEDLSDRLEKMKTYHEWLNHYTKIQTDIEALKLQKNFLENQFSEKLEKYEDLIAKHGVCPFCFSEITPTSLEHIKSHLRGETIEL